MMWTALVSGLVCRAAVVTIDGNPLYPDLREQWRLAEGAGATLMGVRPAYGMAGRKGGSGAGRECDLSRIPQFGAAGSPLPTEGYAWIYEKVKPDALLNVG